MTKAAVRMMIRRNIHVLDRGGCAPALGMFSDDVELALPGDNSRSRPIRSPEHLDERHLER